MNSHGFVLLREEHIDELNSDAQIWRHEKTGAELLSLSNDDENKVFGVSFRTPPADSTGVPHIMEHSVLGGSRKYRVKEPFVELIKGSLYTFVNAFTAPDRTLYPVASTNTQDFYNLIDVYLDAVFHPLITPHHLQQEGWHYELEDIDDPLVYKGVVFNEMKGAYSSPDNVLYRYGQQTLFPDTPYGVDSGGDPEVIPDLTYEQFKAFHDTYYHPSNARIFFYGDDDLEERLRILDGYLREFERLEVDSGVALQRPFAEPKAVVFPYSVEEGQDAAKAMIDINWGLPETADVELVWGLNVLSYALVGTQASPLRKALIDSGLGEDLTGSGLSTSLRQMTFGVGMKGVRKEDAEKVETLIFDTLRQLAADGFEPDMVEAAVNSIEFSLRENNTGSFPRGLGLMMRAMNTWNYGRDPLIPLKYEAPLTAVKTNLAQNPRYLQDLIQTHLLDNTHRVTLLLEPDPTLNQRKEAAEKEKLAAVKASMSAAELQAIIENTQAIRALQEKPDSPEALAAIPTLTLADLEKENKRIPIEKSEAHGSPVLFHDLFTNGIVYLEVGLNLQQVPPELLPYVKLFGSALLKMGTETEDFVKLSQRIGRKTGGISPSFFTATKAMGGDGSAAWLFLHGKATMDHSQELLDIIRDILLTVKLDNRDRFRQIVLEAKARQESGLIPSGHMVVNGRLRAKFSEADWVSEQMGGVTQLLFLRRLSEEVEQHWPDVLAKLEAVRRHLLNRHAMICNVTLDGGNWSRFQPQLHDFLAAMPASDVVLADWSPALTRRSEGLTIPAQVNYVGKGANLYELGYKLHGSVSVINKFLGTTWLWEKVRVQGGAYGGFSTFDRDSGVFNYLSYRDPNLEKTLANYDGTADFLRHLDLPEAELTKSIIGAIGRLDSYQLPDAKGFTSLSRYLIGLTDEARQQYRDEVLSTTAADFRAFGEVLAAVNEHGVVVVLGSAEAINAANGENWLEVSRVM
jgi:Zn-dependent M16 (insulinase) family peptidase